MARAKPVVLLILDGWGHCSTKVGNAIAAAATPSWDQLLKSSPHTLISGSGEDVGLPDGQMGNSEVGHLTMGAGRIIYQDLTRITQAIQNGTFFQNKAFENAFDLANRTEKAVHIMGLLSPGGVHSHEDQIFACLAMAQQKNVASVYVHAFLDGRDTPPQSAHRSLEKLDSVLAQTGGKLASVSGRFYAMDRDRRWERIQLAYQAIALGQANFSAHSGLEALSLAYARQETDEFVQPTCIIQGDKPATQMQSGDIIIFMNFRADRARQLCHVFTDPDFQAFTRKDLPLADFVTLTQYDESMKVNVAFPPQSLKNGLGEYLQHHHLRQLRLAETEKYAHVTYFFNGGLETPYQGEERILIPSPKVSTYDLQPAMSAPEITTVLVDKILHGNFDLIVCNYANADMLGHTGNFQATVEAIEILDQCLAKILPALQSVGGQMLITSDHGNAECMLDPANNQVHTAHTTALVPLVYVGKQSIQFKECGKLSDIAPTLLQLIELEQPKEMTGHSLIQTHRPTAKEAKA